MGFNCEHLTYNKAYLSILVDVILTLKNCPSQFSDCQNASYLKMNMYLIATEVVQHGIFKHP